MKLSRLIPNSEISFTDNIVTVKARLVCDSYDKTFTTAITELSSPDDITTLADPWVRLLSFDMMGVGGTWKIEGTVSKSCLRNMERFMEYWHTIAPDKCHETILNAEQVYDDSQEPTDDSALLPFSGGVDACYTAYRHTHGLAGHKNLEVKAAMMIHGADIPLNQPERFDEALEHNREMLNDIGIDKIHVIRTDYNTVADKSFDWGIYTHMAVLVGLGSFLSPLYKNIVPGSSSPYPVAPLRWGSNPVSDYMLASRLFQVHIDDLSKFRTEKAALIAKWPVGMQKLRVCWESSLNGSSQQNCGHCEKCIRTNLNFLACGVQLPCMPVLSMKEIKANHGEIHLLRQYTTLIDYAKQHGCHEPWVKALDRKIGRCKRKLALPEWVKKIWNYYIRQSARVFYHKPKTKEESWARNRYIVHNSIPLKEE